MKTIVHLIDTLGTGGAEILLTQVVPGLNDYRNVVVHISQPDTLRSQFGQVPVFCLHKNVKRNPLGIIRALRSLLREQSADLIHVHSYWAAIYARLAAPHRVAVVQTYHFADYDTRKELASTRRWLWLDKFTFRKRFQLVAVSQYVADILKREAGFPQVAILRNFVAEKFLNPQTVPSYRPLTPLKLIAVGSAKAEKNYDLLLNAFKEIQDLPVSVDVYGGGPMLDSLRQRAENEKIAHVQFKGNHEAIENLYPHYNAFVMCSFSEACPLSPLEALSAGLPLVLSNIPSLHEIAGPSLAHYFQNKDAASLAQLLRRIFTGEISLQSNANAVQERLTAYSKAQHLQQLKQIYEKALHKRA